MKLTDIFKKKSACGLDLGSHWAKVVRVLPVRNGVQLDRLGRLSWSRKDREKNDNIAQKLQEMFDVLQLKDRTVVSSMAGHAVIIKRVELPVADTKDLDENIHKQAKQYIPFDIDDVYLDFQVMGPGREANTQSVIIVASKKKMVQEVQEIFEKAGLGTSIVDVDGFALSNCFEFNYPERQAQSTYLLDIGASHSVFCVYANSEPIFIRDVAFGGQQVTEKLSSALDQNRRDVEKLKMSGLDSLQEEGLKERAKHELTSLFGSWSEEVQRLITFYHNSLDNPQSSDTLFLSGGGCLLQGIQEHFSNYLELDVGFLDPWKNIDWDEKSFDGEYLTNNGPQFALAVGLALRAAL